MKVIITYDPKRKNSVNIEKSGHMDLSLEEYADAIECMAEELTADAGMARDEVQS